MVVGLLWSLVMHLGNTTYRIGDRTMDKKTIVILIGMMIVDSYQRLKDPYIGTSNDPNLRIGKTM